MLRNLRGLAGGLFFVSTAAFATTIELKPFHAVNVDAKALEVLQLLVQSNLAMHGTVVEGNAEESLEVLVIGLGEQWHTPYLVHFTRKKGDGQNVEAQLTFDRLEEAPTLIPRLADSVYRQVPLEDTRDRHNVSVAEAQATALRVGNQRMLGVKLSFGAPVGANASFNGIGAIGFDGRFEREHYFIELGAGFILPGPGGNKSYGGVGADLGIDYFLTNADTAFYFGGGFTPRLIFSEAMNSPLNVAPYLQVGVLFDRSARMRLYADARVAQNLLPVRESSASATSSGPIDTYPTELTLQVGIGW
jgi:hypothetical protein